jgi:hypothetical protein
MFKWIFPLRLCNEIIFKYKLANNFSKLTKSNSIKKKGKHVYLYFDSTLQKYKINKEKLHLPLKISI